jgi:serine/threonine protein kinase
MIVQQSSMLPARWACLQDVFLEAAALNSEKQRSSFLDRACRGDLELRLEVEAMLAADDDADKAIEDTVEAASNAAFADDLVGRRLGSWLIEREIGRGGMGSVYLGVRADAEFEMRVAIKVIRRGMDTDDVLTRFRHERQILASLEHRNIARLLDGGSTPDGRPYLVMEYIAGRRIDEYCRFRHVSLTERLRLFCEVCDAVAHAHRNLIVHRDLKPGNILVTQEGEPKLLDFGIAKLLSGQAPAGAGEAALTIVGTRMTLEYGSPEQLRGLAVTTSTDVYSLGAVLYELLCGQRAHALQSYSNAEIEPVICDEEPPRPSVVAAREKLPWARQLEGDLDNITLMALRKESERRYSSVEQLAADIQRYQTGMPVLAREDTVLYRSHKFLQRHRMVAIAATLAAASLIGGTGVALREAARADAQRVAAETHRQSAERERARAERESETAQREHLEADRERLRAESNLLEANAQRRRAEARLDQLVSLANHTLTNINDTLEHAPGATGARRMIVKTTLDYLDALSKDAAGDPALMRTIAAAYMRLGDVQGLPTRPSLGDTQGALANYRKAEAIVDAEAARDADVHLTEQWLELQYRIGMVLTSTQQNAAGIAVFEKAIARAEGVRARGSASLDIGRLEGILHQLAAEAYGLSDSERSARHVRREIEIQSKLFAAGPADEELALELATAYGRLGALQAAQHHPAPAVENARKTIAIREEIARRHPDDVMIQRDLMVGYGRLGDFLGGPLFTETMHDQPAALTSYRRALEIAEKLAAADPSNRNARIDVAKASVRVGSISVSAEPPADAIMRLRRASEIFESLRRENPKMGGIARDLSMTWEQLGRRLAESGEREEALGWFRRSITLASEITHADPRDGSAQDQVMHAYEPLLPLLAEASGRDEVIASAEAAIAAAREHLNTGARPDSAAAFLARAWEWQGNVYVKLAQAPNAAEPVRSQDLARAREAYAQSLSAWDAAARKFPLPAEAPVRISHMKQWLAAANK